MCNTNKNLALSVVRDLTSWSNKKFDLIIKYSSTRKQTKNIQKSYINMTALSKVAQRKTKRYER